MTMYEFIYKYYVKCMRTQFMEFKNTNDNFNHTYDLNRMALDAIYTKSV